MDGDEEAILGLLRTLLAFSVLLDHLWGDGGDALLGGRLAVQTFYLISGFLISYVLTATDTYRGARLKFYQNRFLRLYPTYLAVALLTLMAHALLNTSFLPRYAEISDAADAVLLLSNALLVGQDWVMFMGIHEGHLALTGNFMDSDVPLYEELLVPQAWTLGVELDFYLVAPFLLASRRRLWLALLASLALRTVLIATGIGRADPWTYRFFPSELALFLAGALSQQILLPRLERLCARRRRLPALAVAALLLYSVAHFHMPLPPTLRDALFLAVATALLPLAFIFQCRHRWDRRIGELSFPLYISHMLVILLFERLAAGYKSAHPSAWLVAVAAASLAAAVALNLTVGVRVERWRRRIAAAPVEPDRLRLPDRAAVGRP
ncbi:hypothetical protein GCM10023144_18300 [Pigmentiphaga soli]|uniref:Acyltransferase 3 domain-containing protein n=1 Tax=Pigmentiphaga soli TaxID=1007095 RepID=A0ABP8GVF7_9BURK